MNLKNKLLDISIGEGFKADVASKILDFMYFFIRHYKTLKRMIYWANVGREVQDYCADYSLVLINHQLKRFKKHIDTDGHLVWQYDSQDSNYIEFHELLDLSNKVLLEEHPEIEALYVAHKEKWGELKTWFTPYEHEHLINLSEYHSKYTNANTEEEDKQAKKEFSDIYTKEEEYKQELLNKLCDRMKKIRHYWD